MAFLFYGAEACQVSNAQIKSLNFAVSCSFKKNFDASYTHTTVECMKMFDCCEVFHENLGAVPTALSGLYICICLEKQVNVAAIQTK